MLECHGVPNRWSLFFKIKHVPGLPDRKRSPVQYETQCDEESRMYCGKVPDLGLKAGFLEENTN